MNLFVSLLFALVFSTSANSDEIDRILAKFDNVKYSHQYGELYCSLFGACDATELVELNTNKNDSIASQSAWERVAMTVPKEGGKKVYRPDAARLNWFIGFFEGRNRVSAPEWWRTIVLDARANRRDNIYPGKPKEQPYHRSELKWVKCPVDASVEENERVVTYRNGDDSIVIPEELLDRADSGELSCNISCVFTDDNCFVAVHDDVGYSHDVACLDRKSGKVVWASKACGCWWGGATGRHESWVSLVPTDDGRVFVFGSASVGLYAHGFDSSTGKTLVQFSNNY